MRHLILVFLVIGSIMVFFGCQVENGFAPELSQTDQATASEESALAPEIGQSDQGANSLAKPASNLSGIVLTTFNFDNPPYYWRGEVDFGDGLIYGLAFNSHGDPTVRGQSSHFEEEFLIFKFGTDYENEDNVYLHGSNSGIVSNANRTPDPVKFLSNGTVETAKEPFAEWLGRSVHIRGSVTWQNLGTPEEPLIAPDTAEGTFRIN